MKIRKLSVSFKILIFIFYFSSSGFIHSQSQYPSLTFSKKSADIFNVVPYAGVIKSEYSDDDYNLDEDDSAIMKGLYMQWIRPDYFQINSFIYGAEDLYNENFTGFHLMGDYYLNHPQNGRYVTGAGIEIIKPDFSKNISAPSFVFDAEIKNTLYVPFIRAGRYFDFDIGNFSTFSILQWAGYQLAVSRGDAEISIDYDGAGPAPEAQIKEKISDETSSMLLGVTLSLNLMRFVGLDFKYKGVMNSENYFNVIEAMGNIYFTKNIGFSARYKNAENDNGNTIYAIYGIIISF
ncbi:MAG: hypothetical protein RBT69_04405 [Spirochaetia bacterium]|jgi:hypothetical protein|nr:hypothetical protein [Spirochaetia bacterium]